MAKKRKRPTKKDPTCGNCGAAMNTPFDQASLMAGQVLCWVCKTQIMMHRDELWRETLENTSHRRR